MNGYKQLLTQNTESRRTSDAPVARAKEAKRSDSVVERDNDHITVDRQSLAVIDPERVRAAVETTAVYPHLTATDSSRDSERVVRRVSEFVSQACGSIALC